jgi:hypothetical protein
LISYDLFLQLPKLWPVSRPSHTGPGQRTSPEIISQGMFLFETVKSINKPGEV